MAGIATYAFLDLETKNVLQSEQNKKIITKLCMFVVKRDHILDTLPGDLPRVQPKLVVCLNPNRTIEPGSTEASGNETELKFDMNGFNAVKSFLECQQRPICLIAENGFKYIFPILKNLFQEKNIALGDYVKCADSLQAFNDILQMKQPDEILTVQLDKTNKVETSTEIVMTGEDQINDEVDSSTFFQNRNEMSPKKSTNPKNIKGNKVIKKVIDENLKELYELKDIYKQILGRADADTIEKNCIMSAEVSVAIAKQFVQWIDTNHCAFSEVKTWRKRLFQ